MRAVWDWAKVLAVILAAIIAGEVIGPLQDFSRLIERYEPWLLPVAIGMAILGFVIFMGGTIRALLVEGRPMGPRDVEKQFVHWRPMKIGRPPYAWRASVFRALGKPVGREAHDEFPLAAMKQAWKTGAWWRDQRWRWRYLRTLGVLLLFFGMFGIPFVVGPASVKLLVGGAVLYAVARLSWALVHA